MMRQETILERLSRSVPFYDKRFYLVVKRLLDIVISLVLLILLAPLLLLIALCIRLDSTGPVLFRQTRVGLNSRWRTRRRARQAVAPAHEKRCTTDRRKVDQGARPFTMYKFRTMYCGSDGDRHRRFMENFILNHVMEGDSRGRFKAHLFKLVSDPRVTPVGRILRKTSLDELPQLINVIKGDMSLVGPRPAIPYEVECYQEWQKRRFAAIPGITGWWQVRGRSRVTFDEAVRMDIYYAEHCSVGLDVEILLRTPWAVISGKGAA
jgi:lipopolysaccharide/colanic/teichoic acid biosynthesis glycosyltransferase